MPEPSTPPSEAAVLLDIEDLHREFDGGHVLALRGVTLRIHEGEFVAIIGSSGSGKSTLLNLLGALDAPDAGEIRFRGEPLGRLANPAKFRAQNIGFIFQSFHLLPTLTALENVQVPMFEMGWPVRERQRRASELLEAVAMGHRLDHLPEKLSGGERQRVAIARSLANDPSILLADEPTGNLDSNNTDQIMTLLKKVHRDKKNTMILVTHDMEVARTADRIVTMRDGQVVSDERVTAEPDGTHRDERSHP
ncbi:MAG: ABC transporter ATP-binding protein [Verrucomicrobiaceae bacterium]|nr:ABC transporter ATP-binding protein [Verrucomicrobiaceae bacterium]